MSLQKIINSRGNFFWRL